LGRYRGSPSRLKKPKKDTYSTPGIEINYKILVSVISLLLLILLLIFGLIKYCGTGNKPGMNNIKTDADKIITPQIKKQEGRIKKNVKKIDLGTFIKIIADKPKIKDEVPVKRDNINFGTSIELVAPK